MFIYMRQQKHRLLQSSPRVDTKRKQARKSYFHFPQCTIYHIRLTRTYSLIYVSFYRTNFTAETVIPYAVVAVITIPIVFHKINLKHFIIPVYSYAVSFSGKRRRRLATTNCYTDHSNQLSATNSIIFDFFFLCTTIK